VAWSHPAILTEDSYRPELAEDRSALGYYLSAEPDALFRLKRLLLERDGKVEDIERYGLFAYDPRTGALKRCKAGSISARQQPLILGRVDNTLATLVIYEPLFH
jgi:hypothetical protein